MTANAPVIIKRKQSKPSQSSGARPVEGSAVVSVEGGTAQENGNSPAAATSRLRKQQKARRRQKAQPSFGGDGEMVKIKRSNLSRKLRSLKLDHLLVHHHSTTRYPQPTTTLQYRVMTRRVYLS